MSKTPPPAYVSTDIDRALAEDIGSGDLTAALIPAKAQASATVVARTAGVVCGRPWFDAIFARLDAGISISWRVREGEYVQAETVLVQLNGPARPLLTGERTALNFLQTLSATATRTRKFVDAVAGSDATILDTRKTLPGLRIAQKYAVRMGGGANHRIGLYDGILIKENHIIAAGSISAALATAGAQKPGVLLEVETENLDEVREALEAGAPRLLLDNFDLADLRAAVSLRDQINSDALLEASGGVNLKTIGEIAATGVDFISVGQLTKDIQAMDLSMRFEMQQ